MRERTKILTARELAFSAIFAGAVCAATLIIRIPVPATSGYINLGDSMVFISALLMGARIGGIAGGVGSALADLLGGYGFYALPTLIIKGTEGFVVGHLSKKNSVIWSIAAVVVGGFIMIAGYFIVQAAWFGIPNALAELPGNVFQAGSGLLIAVPVATAIKRAMPQRF
ncbi:MAG: ECF transporter S component [Theionarchaea archaeon]|nr:ECF transporter S component [Theionarchaea archaeon]